MMPKLLSHKKHPQENILVIAMTGMTILFIVLLIAYLSLKGGNGWLDFQLPKVFALSTFFMIASSYTLYVANTAFKKEDFFTYRYFLAATIFLGLAFIVCQLVGWYALHAKNLVLVQGKTSVAFLYMISGLHILHLVLGLTALGVLLYQALRKIDYVDSFVYAVNPPNQRYVHLASIFWHFLDILWIMLYIFFYINH